MKLFTFPLFVSLTALAFSAPLHAQRQMENLGRGVVALRQADGKIFISWRLLGTDPDDIAFNVYRAGDAATATKLNKEPITATTTFVDERPAMLKPFGYFVKPVVGGKEQAASKPFLFTANPPARPYLEIPLQTPQGYAANDCSAGDLDGDGEYEIILHQAGRGRDNSQKGETDPPVLQAYKLDGKKLWEINLGRNIREGAHYTQFMVYDLDGDGRSELVCKTADGTIDGRGKVIGDAKADYRSPDGYILSGPEFLTVFDGLTGAALATTNYIPPRHPTNPLKPSSDEMNKEWGDGYGNRLDRFLACVAYLDGKQPSVVMCRGYYTRTVMAAWNWRGGKLSNVWTFDSNDPKHPENKKFAGQGNHNLSVADVDGDGKDEIVYGAMVVDDNGTGLWNSRLGHGDAQHVSDLDPDRPGLEIFGIQEPFGDAGSHLFDAKTGEVLWRKASVESTPGKKVEGPGRACALDIDPRHKGYECWSAGAGIKGLFDVHGNLITENQPEACNFGVLWDGDTMEEILDKNWIGKWNYQASKVDKILTAEGCTSINGTKATPCLSADLLGDWREEVIWRTDDGKALRIYVSTIPTDRRFYTLMHDPQYRLSIAWQNVAYNQPPHPGFFFGDGMPKPPKPNIELVVPKKK